MTRKPILFIEFRKSDDLKEGVYNAQSLNIKAYQMLGKEYEQFIILHRAKKHSNEFATFYRGLLEEPFNCKISAEAIEDQFLKSSIDEALESFLNRHKDEEIHILIPPTSTKVVEDSLLANFSKEKLTSKYDDLHLRAFRFNSRKAPYRRWLHEEYPLEEALPKKTYQELESLTRKNKRVLLIGAEGTDKEEIAKALHQKLRGHLTHFLSLEGADFSQQIVEDWIKEHPNGTIYIEDIGDLQEDEKVQQLSKFLEFLATHPNYAFMVSVTETALLNHTLKSLSLKAQITPTFKDLIKIPSLEERNGEQIEALLNYFVHRLGINKKKKERIVLKHLFIDLKKYPFPGNLWEMENMVRELYKNETITPTFAEVNQHLIFDLRQLQSSKYSLKDEIRQHYLVLYGAERLQKGLSKISTEKLSELFGWGRKKTAEILKNMHKQKGP